MKHSVIFEGCGNHWDNALPLGNGIFGAMVFCHKNRVNMPMNHYEVYYNRSANIRPQDALRIAPPVVRDEKSGQMHRDKVEMADFNQPAEGEPYMYYRYRKDMEHYHGIGKFSSVFPSTGELIYDFADALKDAEPYAALYVEDAKTLVRLTKGDASLSIESAVMREDCFVSTFEGTAEHLVKAVTISFPHFRDTVECYGTKHGDREAPEKIEYDLIDAHTVRYTVYRRFCRTPEHPVFIFSGIVRFVGAEVELGKKIKNDQVILIKNCEKKFRVLTAIVTAWKYEDPKTDCIAVIDGFEKNIDKMFAEHKAYWTEFFNRSAINLPDKMLEKVYYVNQYALDCCSGKDGIMKHQACGLNGLWAIRQPVLWASCWYWDVNIQAAFAGVFSSNRLDLAKVFSDGLQCYVPAAERYAISAHNLSGIAVDYPYFVYYSTWGWCAQYLWFLYEYSLDTEYLKNEAYPLFLKLCEFSVGLFEYDEEKGYYRVYPDISPEQGPLAHDTTITVACTKYLLQFTLKSAEILGDTDNPLLPAIKKLLDNLPPYAISEEGYCGKHFKDSPDAPDMMFIRHPSMLMPVFPIGEYDIDSDPEIVKIISNTIDFLEERTEIGVFQGSWMSATASRIGRGQTALRLLYERGLDHMLRSNGLTAEETERFMNHCLICRQPLYYPCMMEFTGEMLAAVNEMLLQSQNNIIRVFPALPDGDPEYGRLHRNGYSIFEYDERYVPYDAWKTLHFNKLLAKGAFEVSASMKDGVLECIEIHAKKGGTAKVTSPYLTDDMKVFSGGAEVAFTRDGKLIVIETEEGKTYSIATCACKKVPADDETTPYDDEVNVHETYTRRHIYVGEDKDTAYQRGIDGALRDWYIGSSRQTNHVVYKFDFTDNFEKNYKDWAINHAYAVEEKSLTTIPFERLGAMEFTDEVGFGFESADGVKIVKRGGPDLLREDFAEGESEATFVIEAPRGQYELLIVSGDSDEDSVTVVKGDNTRTGGGKVVEKGTFQTELITFITEDDEPIRLHLSTKPGYRWKLNAIIMNVVKGY